MVILWQDYDGKGKLRKSYCSTVGKKFPNWECLFVQREKGLFLSVYVDDKKLAGKKQNINPMWKLLNKEVDLGEPTSFLDHVYLGRTQRQCEISTQQLYKVSTPCIDDHHFKEEEMKSVGELSTTCSQIVLKCLYLARIGRPGILWSTNKLARSITKWTKACDKRLNRLISHIHHTSEYKQYCHVGNTAKQCRL